MKVDAKIAVFLDKLVESFVKFLEKPNGNILAFQPRIIIASYFVYLFTVFNPWIWFIPSLLASVGLVIAIEECRRSWNPTWHKLFAVFAMLAIIQDIVSFVWTPWSYDDPGLQLCKPEMQDEIYFIPTTPFSYLELATKFSIGCVFPSAHPYNTGTLYYRSFELQETPANHFLYDIANVRGVVLVGQCKDGKFLTTDILVRRLSAAVFVTARVIHLLLVTVLCCFDFVYIIWAAYDTFFVSGSSFQKNAPVHVKESSKRAYQKKKVTKVKGSEYQE